MFSNLPERPPFGRLQGYIPISPETVEKVLGKPHGYRDEKIDKEWNIAITGTPLSLYFRVGEPHLHVGSETPMALSKAQELLYEHLLSPVIPTKQVPTSTSAYEYLMAQQHVIGGGPAQQARIAAAREALMEALRTEQDKDKLKEELYPVQMYYHKPGANLPTYSGCFRTFNEARDSITSIQTGVLKQYVAIIEYAGATNRYLVSKGCGDLEVIAMDEDGSGWNAHKEMVSEIVNFVMGTHEMPPVPGESSDCDDDEV